MDAQTAPLSTWDTARTQILDACPQDERVLLAKHADTSGVLGPVETFMAAIAAVPRAAQRLQAARLQRSFADRLANAQARAPRTPTVFALSRRCCGSSCLKVPYLITVI